MNFYIKNIILLLAITSSLNSKAQDEILFLNGKIITGQLIKKTDYELTFKTKKDKQFVIDKYRVFSYSQNKKENIVYEYNTLSGNFLKVNDMKHFVYGERDAQYSYKPIFSNILGLCVGGTAGYFMNKDDAFLYITTPLLYTVGTLIFPTKVQKKRLTNINYLEEDEYLRGYERVARSKRTQGALKSTVIGLGTGFLIGLITNKSSN